jgi:hypothetical protein
MVFVILRKCAKSTYQYRPPSCSSQIPSRHGADRQSHTLAPGNPNVFLNTAADIPLLPRMFDAVSRFTTRPSEEEMRALFHEQAMEPLFV